MLQNFGLADRGSLTGRGLENFDRRERGRGDFSAFLLTPDPPKHFGGFRTLDSSSVMKRI